MSPARPCETPRMIRVIGVCVAVLVAVAAAGGAADSAGQLPLRRSCPPANFRPPYPPGIDEAVAVAKRVVYGQRYTMQGQTIVTSPRNTRLVAAMELDRGVTLIPGMLRWYAVMQRRAQAHPLPRLGVPVRHSDERARLLAFLRRQDRACVVRVLVVSSARKNGVRQCSRMSPERIRGRVGRDSANYDAPTVLARIDENWLDILTGHAAARFTYLDVRDSAEFERLPPRWKTLHIPLDQLRTRSRELPSASIVVYGSTDEETEAAAGMLKALRVGEVRAFVGGFDALRAAGLR